MMRAYDHPKFNVECPEEFDWVLLESPKLEEAAKAFSGMIEHQLRTAPKEERFHVAGLRLALEWIARDHVAGKLIQ